MAKRTLTFREWFKLAAKHLRDEQGSHLCGSPVADVAIKLDVSTQRVYQLIAEGTLDTIDIVSLAGKVSVSLVTEASIERYIAQRVPDRGRQGYFSFQT